MRKTAKAAAIYGQAPNATPSKEDVKESERA
jgi:hypothetical protein